MRENPFRSGRTVDAVRSVLLFSGAVFCSTSAAAAEIPLGTDGEVGNLYLGGLLQPRAEYDRRADGEHQADARLRRAWLDVRGELHDPDLSFRMQLDVGGSASVRDLWLQYAVGDAWALRMGQFTVPFALSRSIGGPNRTFTEIGVAANQFQMPQGRDVGVGLLGSDPGGRWQAAVSLFDGRGRLDRRGSDRPSTDGGLASSRLAYAVLGDVPSHTTTLGDTVQPLGFTLGAGAMGATENHLRDWSLGEEDVVTDQRADWVAGTLDAFVSGGPMALTGAAFQRRVSTDVGPSYTDQGWEAEAAVALPVVDQEIAVRRSVLRRDVDGDRPDAPASGRRHEWAAGWNAFHDGHRRKTQIFAVWPRGGEQLSDWQLQAQHQLWF